MKRVTQYEGGIKIAQEMIKQDATKGDLSKAGQLSVKEAPNMTA